MRPGLQLEGTRVWVTRKAGEALDPTCVVERLQRKAGWMFWGCYSGAAGKGPCLFWDKSWGSIRKEGYCERIVPLVEGWMQLQPGHTFMHDNAPAHAAKETADELEQD